MNSLEVFVAIRIVAVARFLAVCFCPRNRSATGTAVWTCSC